MMDARTTKESLRLRVLEYSKAVYTMMKSQADKMQQCSAAQKKTGAFICLVLAVNIVLMVAYLSARSQDTGSKVHKRNSDWINDSDDDAAGAVYVRWGRTTCPEETTLIYAGQAGGGHYSHAGSSANYVCLPPDPDYEDVSTSTAHAYMYGTEYEGLDFVSGKGVHDHNVPCAVCQSLGRSRLLVLPAKNRCYPGWHLEYNGYLVAHHYSHSSNKVFECLDHDPEAEDAGYRNENGALMYRTNGVCGSLACPPYIQGLALTCAVCTK